jgi:hypothetical protein
MTQTTQTTEWKKLEYQPYSDHSVWEFAKSSGTIYNIVRNDKPPRDGDGGYTSIEAIVKLKGFKPYQP